MITPATTVFRRTDRKSATSRTDCVSTGKISGHRRRFTSNLPAAAALRPASTAGLWAAILAIAISPNLLLTGSVATLICRRIARDAGAMLWAWQFTAAGSLLVPVQLAAAAIGLHLTGALH